MIEPGTPVGPYEILALLGEGGMGEVYRARDTRLDRIVAIKVIAAHLTDNPQGRERLEREAKAISGLNHPHICTLYDIGRQGDIDFLVMEYLEGETLAARMAGGPLPLAQALELAIQVASALDLAHRQGITHRDLKPANVMLVKANAGAGSSSTRSQVHAKLLDFGLAKVGPTVQSSGSVSMLATQAPSVSLTAQGTIVGTLQYMAPEQLEGAEVDARTDIFALGTLIYEMVTGRKAFESKSQAGLISAIMSADPPAMSTVQAVSPPALDHLVRTCLAKEPAERWQTAHDVVTQLKWIAQGGSQVGVVSAPAADLRRPRKTWMTAALAAAAALVAAMALPTIRYFRGAPPPDPIRFSVDIPQTPNPTSIAISPDGRTVAFVALKETGQPAIFLRALDSMEVRPIAGTENGAAPFWSPDSRFIGFFVTANRMAKVAAIGGAPQVIGNLSGLNADWNADGTILFSTIGRAELQRVQESGGAPEPVEVDTPLPALFPQFLPDGRRFLYTAPRAAPPGIYAASLDSKESHLVLPVVSSAAYADPGTLIFQREGKLFAQSFDPDSLTMSGDPVPIADVYFNPTGKAAATVSRNGVLAYRDSGGIGGIEQFVWLDRTGKMLGTAGKPDAYTPNFDLSPDGSHIVLSLASGASGDSRLWLMDWQRGVTQPLTVDSGGVTGVSGRDVVWSPDGSQVAYSLRAYGEKGEPAIIQRKANGLGSEEVLITGPGDKWIEDWSQDGRYILYGGRSETADRGVISALPLFGDRKPFVVVESQGTSDESHFSFDTKWIAYSSTESGTSQIWVISFPSLDQKVQISDRGGAQPRWNRDGTELYYLSFDGKMMVADITGGVTLRSGAPRVLFDTGLGSIIVGRDQYDVTPDGSRFLLLKPIEKESRRTLNFVVNWPRLLPR